MNRSFESRGANGVGHEGSSHEPNDAREPRDDWRHHAQLERPYGGYIGDREPNRAAQPTRETANERQ